MSEASLRVALRVAMLELEAAHELVVDLRMGKEMPHLDVDLRMRRMLKTISRIEDLLGEDSK